MSTQHSLITTNPGIASGEPIVAGTRITVLDIMRRIQANQSVEEIMDNLHLTRQQVLAAQSYAQEKLLHVPTAAEEAADLDHLLNE